MKRPLCSHKKSWYNRNVIMAVLAKPAYNERHFFSSILLKWNGENVEKVWPSSGHQQSFISPFLVWKCSCKFPSIIRCDTKRIVTHNSDFPTRTKMWCEFVNQSDHDNTKSTAEHVSRNVFGHSASWRDVVYIYFCAVSEWLQKVGLSSQLWVWKQTALTIQWIGSR